MPDAQDIHTGTILSRFWKYASDQPGLDCWEWQGGKTAAGYGELGVGTNKTMYAHRLSYRIYRGDIPRGLYICHACDNPGCVNPAHLFLGSDADNQRDKIQKGRSKNQRKTYCIHGHAFDEKNTRWRKDGGRTCRKCVVISCRRSKQRQAAKHARGG
jgi:hypothetical protein